MASYCCSRFLFAFLAIFHIFLPSFTQKDKKGNENLSATVFKFIYDNEQICGDMFANSSWLPAHQNCELKCRMDSEICQMSSEVLIIRRQRCLELPVECRRQLKQLLGGAELYTKPKRREGPIPTRIFKSKIPKANGGNIQGSIKENEKSMAVRDPAAHIPPSPSSPPITSPQSPRQILISLSSRKPLMNTPPVPELVPLSLDKEILIPPAQLHTTSPMPLSSTIIFINSPSPISIKNGPIQLPSQTKEQTKQPPHSRMITASPKVGAKKEKVDDSLQIAYQNLYMDSSKATQRIGSSTLRAIAVSSPPTSTLVPSKSSLQIPRGHTNSFEQESAELGQPFAGNPFASNPTGVGPTELSVLSAPLFTQLQHLPQQPPWPIEEAAKGEEKKKGAGGKDGEKERSYAVFGPPMSRKQLEQGIGKPPQQIQIHPLPAQPMAIQPSGYFPQQPVPSRGAVVQIKQIGDSKQKEQRDEKEGRRPSSLEKKGGKTGGGKHNPAPQQYDGKLMPWWIWRALAENFRNSKKPHFYSTGDAAFLSMDKTVHCCQWALDGLCDRSWQRVRELCPKSCGNVVCSSIDGTLSCNRLVNVDVIACYEQRRTFHRQFLAAPTLEMAQEGGLELAAEGMEQFPRGNAEGEIVVSKTAEQRAFAIEEEIKGLLGVMEGMGKRNSGGEAKEGGFRRRR